MLAFKVAPRAKEGIERLYEAANAMRAASGPATAAGEEQEGSLASRASRFCREDAEVGDVRGHDCPALGECKVEISGSELPRSSDRSATALTAWPRPRSASATAGGSISSRSSLTP